MRMAMYVLKQYSHEASDGTSRKQGRGLTPRDQGSWPWIELSWLIRAQTLGLTSLRTDPS